MNDWNSLLAENDDWSLLLNIKPEPSVPSINAKEGDIQWFWIAWKKNIEIKSVLLQKELRLGWEFVYVCNMEIFLGIYSIQIQNHDEFSFVITFQMKRAFCIECDATYIDMIFSELT